MKRLFAAVLTALTFVLISCDLFEPESNDPEEEPIVRNITIDNDGIPEWYPSTLVFSNDRINDYDSVLNAFKDTFNIENSVMSSYELSSICGHLKHSYFYPGIRIMDQSNAAAYNEDFVESIEAFAKEWRRLISSEPVEITERDINSYSGECNFIIKSFYEYPVYSHNTLLGYFGTRVDSSGTMSRLYSNIAPQLIIPKNPMYDADSAKAMAIGFEWNYYSYSGERVDCVVDSSDIGSASLQVYIDRKSDEYVYHLIWCISTSGLPIDIIYDAMTGEFIRYVQNFRT